MDMTGIREWLIQNGISPAELDEVTEPPVIRDIGEALTLLLVNGDALGEMIVMMLMEIETLKQRVSVLERSGA